MRVLPAAVSALVLLVPAIARAQPQIPATVYGSVTIDGQPAPTGTEVRAFIGPVDCTQAAPGERPAFRDGAATAYVVTVLHESQRPGCGRTGAVVTFTIDGRPALQSVAWEPGPIRLDLSLGSATTIPLPTSTPTPPGGAATPAPPPLRTGTPPTDDITPPGNLQPGGAGGPGGSAAGPSMQPQPGSGSPLWPWLVIPAAGIAAAAGFAALRLRRKRPAGD
ncbi:hypothetical protein [Tepidiforma sp.]|uniref:hypothetical protein n=1 Tax=Tepidiforma sp. TaxID=2682230 RepID=UPI00261B59C2|nr:hypothetical protein [Tepidiforma sp.]MCX7617733.1 hypothetical protein [Tepidiforma sp.]